MTMPENLVRLNNEINLIYEQINLWLRMKDLNSGNNKSKTSINYKKHIQDFFRIIKNKEINYLTYDDIQVTLNDINMFMVELQDRGKENTTINTKVAAIISLLRFLYTQKINNERLVKDIDYIEHSQIKRLKENSNEYGVLTIDEVFQMAKLALTTEREKKEIKYYFILFALDTLYRKNALLNIKWTNFEEREDFVFIKVNDKGNKKYRQKISKEFFNELSTLKNGSEKVFDLSSKAVDDMMNRLKEKMNISKERNIVFHSIRKAGITFTFRVTGDALATMKAANHSTFNTTVRYIESNDYGVIGAYSSSKDLDLELYRKVSHEDLLNTLDQMKNDYKILLTMKLKGNLNK